ncbi:MAG: exosortase/archaeosortase family protein [Planctomycetota bacterium]|nr:exosortase/archaeosortase family protein [Planctomycetota bacterium]
MKIPPRRIWRARDYAFLTLLAGVAIWLHRQPLMDIINIGLRDEEQSHIFLAPLVAAWLLWLRRSRVRYVALRPNLVGPAVVAGGWLASWWGFEAGIQVAWHGGAMVTLIGVLLSFTGPIPLRLFAPVFAVLAFLLPIPGGIRHSLAWPLQEMATGVTHATLELIGVSSLKSGNVLIINGEQVAVGEACNGMRMVFALTLVVYAFAFGTPLKPATRLILIALSPVVAIVCNVIRLVPTSLIFGYGNVHTAQVFHDLAGWAMLPLALIVLVGVLRMVRWLEFPVMSFRLATQ